MVAFALVCMLSIGPAFAYASIVYWLDRFEKEPTRLLVGAFAWGAFVATIGALVWGLALQWSLALFVGEDVADVTGTVLIAPLVEESLKGAALALLALLRPHEFDTLLDGLVYGAIVGLGFAATENVLYLFSEYLEGGYDAMLALFGLRVILGGWGHAVYTACIGVGIAAAIRSHHWLPRIAWPALGWLTGIGLHALHNGLATLGALSGAPGAIILMFLTDWLGWALALLAVLWEVRREQRWLREHLRPELEAGVLTAAQYALACSFWGQTRARLRSRTARRFFGACADLAQKRQRLAEAPSAELAAQMAAHRAEVLALAPLMR